ncbi:MAG: hypothetical protein CSA35_06570 [Dethiosulfovibrio peptidovorans]|nr:MAG: hypothetical protein CSA35_06570 [Dethiosulfovibrio peptidovorans]
MEEKKSRQAFEASRQALILEGASQTYGDFCFICLNLGLLPGTGEAFQRALPLNPQDPEALYNLELLSLREENIVTARKRDEVLEQLHPKGAKDLRNQITLYFPQE